jgi:DNA-directed RNA polymerase subunit beta
VTTDVAFYSALEEEAHVIAQANAPLDKKNKFSVTRCISRRGGEFVWCRPRTSTDGRVAEPAGVGRGVALIPFLENDDANRALMGSNMQRQAVPLMRTARRSSARASSGGGA